MAGELNSETQGSDLEQGLTVVTKDDFVAADLEAPIRDSNNVDCWSLANLYDEAATKHAESKHGIEFRVFGLLSAVSNMHFKPKDRAEPFGPFFVMNGRRGIIPADLRGDQTVIFSELVPIIQNSGLRARLADIAWFNNRALAAMAQQAINAYCEAIQRVFDGKSEFFNGDRIVSGVAGCDMLLRAVQIARATGWKDPEASRLTDLISP